jgi:hypothetical protein
MEGRINPNNLNQSNTIRGASTRLTEAARKSARDEQIQELRELLGPKASRLFRVLEEADLFSYFIQASKFLQKTVVITKDSSSSRVKLSDYFKGQIPILANRTVKQADNQGSPRLCPFFFKVMPGSSRIQIYSEDGEVQSDEDFNIDGKYISQQHEKTNHDITQKKCESEINKQEPSMQVGYLKQLKNCLVSRQYVKRLYSYLQDKGFCDIEFQETYNALGIPTESYLKIPITKGVYLKYEPGSPNPKKIPYVPADKQISIIGHLPNAMDKTANDNFTIGSLGESSGTMSITIDEFCQGPIRDPRKSFREKFCYKVEFDFNNEEPFSEVLQTEPKEGEVEIKLAKDKFNEVVKAYLQFENSQSGFQR